MVLGLTRLLASFVCLWLLQSCSDTKLRGGSSARKPATADAKVEPVEIPETETTADEKLGTDDGTSAQICDFQIPVAEWDGIDGSANQWIKGGNHAFIDWSRCPKQETNATVDNGGIRINFKNPPASGKLTLTVKTQHARLYRVGYAADIVGAGLPTIYTHNSVYVYECEFAASVYNCVMK